MRIKGIDYNNARIQAAIAAMHGILTAPVVEGIDPNPSQDDVAKWSVSQADKLIQRLKETEES